MNIVSDGWTFLFGAFVAVLFGWGFVAFAGDLFLILNGDRTTAEGERHGLRRPLDWVVVRSRRIPLSGFEKWLYTFMAVFFGGAALALLSAYALAADLPLVNRTIF